MVIPVIIQKVQTTDPVAASFLPDDDADYIYVLEDCLSSYTNFIQDIRGSSSHQMSMKISRISGDCTLHPPTWP